jgi:hypothetical protein
MYKNALGLTLRFFDFQGCFQRLEVKFFKKNEETLRTLSRSFPVRGNCKLNSLK